MNCFPFAYVCDGYYRYFSMWPSAAASEALFFLYARSDGLDDHQSHREGLTAIFDVMQTRNSIKISIDRPNITIRILIDQQAHRSKPHSEQRIAEDQESRRQEFDSGLCGEFRLVSLRRT